MNHSSVLAPRDETALRKETVAWYVRLCSGAATAADHLAWQQWHAQHPDHQRAWQRIASISATVQRVPPGIAVPTLRASGQSRQRVDAGRRQLLRGLALFAGTGSLAVVSYRMAERHALWHSWMAEYSTGVGRQRELALADGSHMMLNTASAADVVFSEQQRLVRLWAGEVLIETARYRQLGSAQSSQRPFVVETSHGRVRALGTRFTVHRQAEQTVVNVLDDAVEVRPADPAANTVLLHAGQQISFTRAGTGPLLPADAMAGAWDSGSLVVSDQALGAVVAQLARYRHGHLECDPAVAGIRVSGAFPLNDIDKALAVITKTFPVRVHSLTRFWVHVVPA
ncbi:FecR domain-containing protein [Variovorax sp. HJSM1_2]|uniref:FecR domain-containing protein n=1 Tax=Variovorax sp. HJSM1_2 TaxID=3366263 RepID=UPI003BE66A13